MILDATSLLDQNRALLAEASCDALARIQADHERAPAKLKPLLKYIQEHLFDPQLTVYRMKAACHVRDNSLTLVFHARIGTPPKSYISHRRLETAVELLRETQLRIWQIAELVGYSGLSVFGKAFERWAGERPSVYRRRVQAVVSQPLQGAVVVKVDDTFLERAVAGTLPDDHAFALIRRVVTVYRPRPTEEARTEECSDPGNGSERSRRRADPASDPKG